MDDHANVSSRDLEIIDQVLRVRAIAPDGGEYFPPIETAIARIYVAGKVRLGLVPALLDAGLRNVRKMDRYAFSMDLFPKDTRRG